MKNIIKAAVLVSAFLLTAPAAYAEVVGEAVITDIGAFIDYLPISSYNVDGSTYIQAEDLRSYGFDVVWDESARTLDIAPNGSEPKSLLNSEEINTLKEDIDSGSHMYDIYSTDIVTRICGDTVNGCSLDGVMLIKFRDLERCAYINFDEEYRTASAEVTRYCMEKAYEAADKQILDLGSGKVYTGEVQNGVPHGIGRLTQTGTQMLCSTSGRGSYPIYNYDHDEEYTDTYTGYFENGLQNGAFYSVTRPVVRLGSMYQHNGMEFLSTAYACEYYSGGTLMSVSGEVNINSEENIMGTPARSEYVYVGNNTFKGWYYLNRISDMESCQLSPSKAMVYGGQMRGGSGLDYNLTRHRFRDENVKFISCGDESYYSYAISEDGDLYVWGFGIPTSDSLYENPFYVRRNVGEFGRPYTDSSMFTLANYRVIARDNKMYLINYTFDDSKDTLVRENVAETERTMYLTTDGSLYLYHTSGNVIDQSGENDMLIDTDVAHISNGTYLKNDGTVWLISVDNEQNVTKHQKIAENAQILASYDNYYCSVAYISNDGEVFYCYNVYDEEKDFVKIADSAKKVKVSSGSISVLNTDDTLYRINVSDGVPGEAVHVMDNAVDFNDFCNIAVTQDGKLWRVSITDGEVSRTQLFAYRSNLVYSEE